MRSNERGTVRALSVDQMPSPSTHAPVARRRRTDFDFVRQGTAARSMNILPHTPRPREFQGASTAHVRVDQPSPSLRRLDIGDMTLASQGYHAMIIEENRARPTGEQYEQEASNYRKLVHSFEQELITSHRHVYADAFVANDAFPLYV